jgi:hypothetical protein
LTPNRAYLRVVHATDEVGWLLTSSELAGPLGGTVSSHIHRTVVAGSGATSILIAIDRSSW